MNSHKIYISYSKTNKQADEWEERFCHFLSKLFHTYISKNVVIGSSSKSIKGKSLPDYSVFIVILDDVYLSTAVSELKAIQEQVEKGVTSIDNVFVVRRTNVSIRDNAFLNKKFLYDFFVQGSKSKNVVELSGEIGSSDYKKYWAKLVDVAFDIRQSHWDASAVQGAVIQTIYLAYPSPDQQENWIEIKRELQHHGYRVLPEKPLLSNNDSIEQQIKEDLKSSVFSVHLIGANNGAEIYESKKGIVEIQNDLAAFHCDNIDVQKDFFQRLIWMSPELSISNEQQQLYIQQLRQSTEALSGAEIIQAPLEVFKQIVKEKIIQSQKEFIKRRELSGDTMSGGKSVYLISDEDSSADVKKLKELLTKNNYTPLILNGLTSLNLLEQHRNNLAYCDRCIILYTKGNAMWLNSKLNDLMKAPGFGRTKPLIGNVIINKSGITINKTLLEKHKYANLTLVTDVSEKMLKL